MSVVAIKHVVIVEKNMETAEALMRLCDALGLPAEIAQTHAIVLRACAAYPVGIIFMNPMMNMINPRVLLEEIHDLATKQRVRPAPVLFMVESTEMVQTLGLKGRPGTGTILKPLALEQVYVAFEKLALTDLSMPLGEDTAAGKMIAWEEFVSTSEEWMAKLRDNLIPK